MILPSLDARIEEPELMDSGSVPAAELDDALDFLSAANRYLGGWALMRRLLDRWSARWSPGRTVEFLDVGTGAGDLPRLLLRWARARGQSARVTAIDADPLVLELARRRCEGEADLVLARATLAEFSASGRRFDYVLGSLLLHHIPDGELVAALRACDRLARRGLLFGDLRRSAAAYVAVRAATLASGRVSRSDGPLSVRRAFRPEELEAAAARAGLSYLRARVEPFFRLSLSGEKA